MALRPPHLRSDAPSRSIPYPAAIEVREQQIRSLKGVVEEYLAGSREHRNVFRPLLKWDSYEVVQVFRAQSQSSSRCRIARLRAILRLIAAIVVGSQEVF